jgi:hypothetical protein
MWHTNKIKTGKKLNLKVIKKINLYAVYNSTNCQYFKIKTLLATYPVSDSSSSTALLKFIVSAAYISALSLMHDNG